MLARSVLALLAAELLAYAALARALMDQGLGAPAAALACLALHVSLRAGPVLVAFGLAGRRDDRPRCAAATATLVAGECVALWANYLLVPFARRTAGPPDARVVLVHGFLCNAASWTAFRRRLAKRGLPARAVTLEPVLGSLDAMADALGASLDAHRPVVIVAHSMGGLVARRLLQRWPEAPVAGLVTIATPHGGTALARLAPGVAGAALRRASRWLAALDAGPGPADRPRVAVWSPDDELVVPATGARWPGAGERCEPGLGHLALLWSARVADGVAADARAMLGTPR